MELALKIIIYIFITISLIMLLKYFVGLIKTFRYIKKSKINKEVNIEKKVNMMILIPVLREQNIICDTIDYFKSLNTNNLVIHMCLAGTKREYASLEKYGFKESTKDVYENYIKNHTFNENFTLNFYEADDIGNGDRATQLNFAAQSYMKENDNIDIIGVYDADSRPTIDTLIEVSQRFLKDGSCSYQQPAFFLEAVANMNKSKENPLLIANALYQNTWSIISEIPMWIDYGKKNGKGKGNFYCIGHGEFFPKHIYDFYNFPEHQVTDGIQIGYRLGMAGEKVDILNNYCNDDVPHNLLSLINQHRRWYGGCNRLYNSFDWCKKNNKKPKLMTMISGFWSQFRWAFTANIFIIILILSILLWTLFGNFIPFAIMGGIFIIYCYMLPLIAIMITPCKTKVSFLSYILIPFAIYIKSIGPNIYYFNKIFRRKNNYGKVER